MCGIFGHTSTTTQIDLERSREALQTLAHRGPDQWGDWHDERVYIGHRRLSILDLSEQGRQPMRDAKNQVIVAVNGEIYNYQDLKKQLFDQYQFLSASDSEIVLHGYDAWGIDGLLERLQGMYAFCIYDARKQKLHIARDRVGIKPLYFGQVGGCFVWASELKAIVQYFGGELEPNGEALYDFLTYLYVPSPKSMYKNVHKLEPAHRVEYDLRTREHKKIRYWQLDPSVRPISIPEAIEELKFLIRGAVRSELMSDVPVGCFLSGGMDSSVVTAEAASMHPRLLTFSIGFEEADHDESFFAKQVANEVNTTHYHKNLSEEGTIALFSKLRNWYDEPFADTSAFPTNLVSKYARHEVTVALTGDGGDEVFGGYNWYTAFHQNRHRKSVFPNHCMKLLTQIPFIPKRIRNKFQNIRLSDLELYALLMGSMTPDEKQPYAKHFEIPEDYDDYWYFRKYYREDLPLMTRLQYLDFHTYLPDDILTKVDRASMAVSLEARVPLLSKQVVEFCFSLPEEVRLHNAQLKGLLKSAYSNTLPDNIIKRSKKGFSIPAGQWRQLFPNETRRQEQIACKLFSDLFPTMNKSQ